MGKRRDSIETLLKRCEGDLGKIEQEYRDSLHRQQVSADLQVDIKNFCENLRSVLDYLAHDMREKHCPTAAKARFYFPILDSHAAFQAQALKWYPNLDTGVPDLFSYLESIRPYHQGFAWLGTFNVVNNENKHGDLVARENP